MSNEIRRAIDMNLASMRVTETDAQYMAASIRARDAAAGRPRKFSAALALALVLTLLTVGAVAAVLLTGREVVEQYVVPMSNQVEGDNLTMEQTRQVLTMTEENGIELSDEAKDHIARFLAKGEGYYKEEMIMAIAKAEFGSQPEFWTLDEQKWFSDMCVTIGWGDGAFVMPEGGENAKNAIISTAAAFIRSEYGDTAALTDPEQYRVATHYQYNDGDKPERGCHWELNFCPRYPEGTQYYINLDEEGGILSHRSYLGAGEGRKSSDVYHGYRNAFGCEIDEWTQAQLRQYQAALRLTSIDWRGADDYLILRSDYPDVAPEALSMEQVRAIILAEINCPAEDCAWLSARYIGDEPNPVWKLRFVDERRPSPSSFGTVYYMEIDSITGEIKHEMHYDRGGTVSVGRNWGLALHTICEEYFREKPEEVIRELTATQARSAAAAYIRQRWRVDITDEARFLITAEKINHFMEWQEAEWEVIAREGSKGYWVWLNRYGEVVDSGLADEHSLDDIRRKYRNFDFYAMDMRPVYEDLAQCTEKDSPLVQTLLRSRALEMSAGGISWEPYVAVCRALQTVRCEPFFSCKLENGGKPICHVGVMGNKGGCWIDLDAETLELISMRPCEDPCLPWYAALMSNADYEALGLPEQPNPNLIHDGSVVDLGVMPGEPDIWVMMRFKLFYGAQYTQWSQAQLAQLQKALLESSGQGSMEWACLSASRYPAVPEEAISRQRAAELAAAHLKLTEWSYDSAVLLGSSGNPIWKVALYVPDLPDSFGYTAEVDCLTGEVLRTSPAGESLWWYAPLVLDETIDYMLENFNVTEHG